MKKIALLGGSFNPFHNGHKAMLDAAIKGINPDTVIIMPAKKPPHKMAYMGVKDIDRFNMLKCLEKDYDNVIVSDMELKTPGFSYTKDTVFKLKKLYPDSIIYFIMGGDSIENFEKWREPDTIVKYACICVCIRNEANVDYVKDKITYLKDKIGGNYYILNFERIDISSTMIRNNILNNISCRGLLPDSILEYIIENNLYRKTGNGYSLKELVEIMEQELLKSRYIHSLGVMNCAADLAVIYNVDINRAMTAGILHDCAKIYSAAELINICGQNNVYLSANEKSDEQTTKNLVHSKAGSIIAHNIYFIDDEEILSAIYYHTVGRPAMTMLEKIIFVADYIEPGRKQLTNPPLDEIRRIAYEDIDKSVELICKNTIDYLNSIEKYVDNNTLETYDYYKAIREDKNE